MLLGPLSCRASGRARRRDDPIPWGRARAGHGNGLLEFGLRVNEFPLSEQHPAEAVDVRGGFGFGAAGFAAFDAIDGDRVPDETFGFVEVASLVGQVVAKIVARAGIVRVVVENRPQDLLRLGGLLRPHVGETARTARAIGRPAKCIPPASSRRTGWHRAIAPASITHDVY